MPKQRIEPRAGHLHLKDGRTRDLLKEKFRREGRARVEISKYSRLKRGGVSDIIAWFKHGTESIPDLDLKDPDDWDIAHCQDDRRTVLEKCDAIDYCVLNYDDFPRTRRTVLKWLKRARKDQPFH